MSGRHRHSDSEIMQRLGGGGESRQRPSRALLRATPRVVAQLVCGLPADIDGRPRLVATDRPSDAGTRPSGLRFDVEPAGLLGHVLQLVREQHGSTIVSPRGGIRTVATTTPSRTVMPVFACDCESLEPHSRTTTARALASSSH